MLPSRTTFLLLTVGLLLWLAGLAAQSLQGVLPVWLEQIVVLGSPWAVFGFDGCVLLLFAADAAYAWRATRFGRIAVRRERPARLSLGVDNEIVLILDNRSPDRLTLDVRDDVPAGFRADPIVQRAVVPALGQSRLPYRLLPTQRGNFSFGDVSVRCRGPLGLAFFDGRLPAGEAVQVYPNLLEVRRYEALVRTTLVRAGGYRAKRLPGAGREFSHYRDYSPDDDYRQVELEGHRPPQQADHRDLRGRTQSGRDLLPRHRPDDGGRVSAP